MLRNVIISNNWNNNINEDGEQEDITFVTQGVYDDSDGVQTLRYHESDEESGERYGTNIVVEGERVSVTDEYNLTHLMFQKGLRFSSVFADEENGTYELGVFPTKVDIQMGEESGLIGLSYQMDIDGDVIGDNSINISYRSVN